MEVRSWPSRASWGESCVSLGEMGWACVNIRAISNLINCIVFLIIGCFM